MIDICNKCFNPSAVFAITIPAASRHRSTGSDQLGICRSEYDLNRVGELATVINRYNSIDGYRRYWMRGVININMNRFTFLYWTLWWGEDVNGTIHRNLLSWQFLCAPCKLGGSLFSSDLRKVNQSLRYLTSSHKYFHFISQICANFTLNLRGKWRWVVRFLVIGDSWPGHRRMMGADMESVVQRLSCSSNAVKTPISFPQVNDSARWNGTRDFLFF